ncbi:hypothetical protein EV385_5716 [Krasilnikovia cinnamomea]|uniref:Uncharacterized protein n=1 Tax=Krasilnikovia cinnamomea TaxID=349313 RepID=A0A4Q7ZRL0_9ACTN|nr:hypothetical protein [Krasilnikovia cinnamomea]RZU53782.1 hypothetical protein EV385_5716 [Krasilnikovia cinnamomea]
MSSRNRITPLPFSGRHVEARVVTDVRDFPLTGRVIVVNLDTTPAYLARLPRTPIPAFSSTIAVDSTLAQAKAVVLLQVLDEQPVSGITDEPGWQHFTDIAGPDAFPRTTPLYRSARAEVGTVRFDPHAALGATHPGSRPRDFTVRLMLWYCPPDTACGIHNRHDFIETHAQVVGHGRMQKFADQEPASLYEDVLMSPGYATPVPFCGIGPDTTFTYPWHQYKADTDCVWLAVEYHLAD